MTRFPPGIMSTCCVPWDGDGRFVEPIFRRAVRTALEGAPNLYVFGTAGEGYAVTDGQFDQVVAAFVEEMRHAHAEPMVGVIHLSMGTIVERIERCRDRGVRQFQISLPSWGALADGEVFDFFDRICTGFPDCQFMHYNLPRAKRIVTGKEYGRLAQSHPNLVATKNTGDSLSHIRGLIDEAPQLQHFLSEAGYLYGSLFGECSVLASFVTSWTKLSSLFEAGSRRDVAALTSIQREVDVLIETLFEAVPAGRIDGAYDKLFARMYDPSFPLRMLPPYVGSSETEFQTFVRLLEQRLPEWIPAAPDAT